MANKRELLRLLQQQKDFTPSSILANKLNISIRTLRNLVAEANQKHILIESSRKGYKLAEGAWDPELSPIPETPSERQSWLKQRIIYSADPQDLEELANELFISDSTLKNDLLKIQKSLQKHHLRLSIHQNSVACHGSELDKRQYINTLLRKEGHTLFTNYQVIQSLFPELEIRSIESLLQAEFYSRRILINGYSLLNMTLHLCISIQRIRSGCSIEERNFQPKDTVPPVAADIAASLRDNLEPFYHITFNEPEFFELACLVLTYIPSDCLPSQDLSPDPEETDCHQIVNEIVESINASYYIDLSASLFQSRFLYHLQNLILRVKNNAVAKNELSFELKKSYPLIYDISVYAASIIQKWIHCPLPDDEIAYIALHIGYSAERNRSGSGQIRASLLCPNYYDFQETLLKKIQNAFPTQFTISQLIVSDLDISFLEDTDFLITTYPVSSTELPVVCISPFLTESDEEKIRKTADEIQKERKLSFFRAYISSLFSPELFLSNPPSAGAEDVIHSLSQLLLKAGVTGPDYEQQILYRESLSPTAFGRFAIPHTLEMNASRSQIAAAVFKKAIPWGEHFVNLVFMIALNKNDRDKFSEIFSILSDSLFDDSCVEKLSQSNTYLEMLNLLVSFIR